MPSSDSLDEFISAYTYGVPNAVITQFKISIYMSITIKLPLTSKKLTGVTLSSEVFWSKLIFN